MAFAHNATLEQYLRAVPEAGVAAWMAQEVKTNSGASLLHRRFVKKIRQVPLDYIIALLLAPLSDA